MGTGKLLALLAGIITLVGTYVIAIYGIPGNYAGSGLGFVLNIPDLFADAATYAALLSIEVWLFYILCVVFIIFLAAGLLQIIFMKSKLLSILFSLFPLGVGLMFVLLFYTDILGIKSAFFGLFFIGEHYGGIFPFVFNYDSDLAIGAYVLLAGGALGLVSGFLPREDY